MDNILIISLLTAFLFCLAKVVIMKFVDKELQPLKVLVKDAIIVFTSAAIGSFAFFKMNGNITDMLNVLTDTKTVPVGMGTTEIFTDVPTF
jgi:DMSO reductase anchor subunit